MVSNRGITMPLLNTTEVFLDWGRTTVAAVLEPGETYFFIYDFHTGQQMFMGKNGHMVRALQGCACTFAEIVRTHEGI